MIGQTLHQLIEDKITSAREIGELTGAAPSTVYRWISEETEPDFNAVRLLLRHLPRPEAQRAILTAFLAGTPWRFDRIEPDLDINNDGRIDANDALDASIELVQSAGESLRRIRHACLQIPMPEKEATLAIDILDRVVRQCCLTQQVLSRVCDQHAAARRKAKPAPPPGAEP